MKTFTYLFLVIVLLLSSEITSKAQTPLHTVDFESASGYTTSVFEYLTGVNAYYTRINYSTSSSNISVPANYTGYQGNWIFAMEDTGGSTETQTMTLSDVNITGYSSLHVKVLVAGQNNTAGTLETNKHMSFYANIDGGGEVLIGSFRGNGTSSYLYKDDNLNGSIEAGETTVLTSAFTEYNFNINGSGSNLVITIKCLLSTANEEGAFDNIRVLGSAVQSAPSATTNIASNLTSNSATLNGSVNANGASTTVNFEYGTTLAYGNSVTAIQSPITGTSATTVSYEISGLTQNTTYHYRVVAVNSGGTTYGSDQTFNTTISTDNTQLQNRTIELFPNPTRDGFFVNAEEKNMILTISDLSGRNILI